LLSSASQLAHHQSSNYKKSTHNPATPATPAPQSHLRLRSDAHLLPKHPPLRPLGRVDHVPLLPVQPAAGDRLRPQRVYRLDLGQSRGPAVVQHQRRGGRPLRGRGCRAGCGAEQCGHAPKRRQHFELILIMSICRSIGESFLGFQIRLYTLRSRQLSSCTFFFLCFAGWLPPLCSAVERFAAYLTCLQLPHNPPDRR